MTTYVMLTKFTEQGICNAKDSHHRFDKAKHLLAEMGGSFKQFFLTMGKYNFISVYKAPDDAVAARFNFQLGMLGIEGEGSRSAPPEGPCCARRVLALGGQRGGSVGTHQSTSNGAP